MSKRNTVEIKVWMVRNGIRPEDIRRELGYRDSKVVRATLYGEESNRKVLRWLLDKGCPAEMLALPEQMS